MNDLIKFINKLPDDIIINHIIPYIYQPQPNNILCDIRSYVADYKFIESIYMTQFNEYVLLNDLIQFYGIHLTPYYGLDDKFDTLLRRHFSIKNKNEEKLINMVRLNFHRNIENNAERKVRFLLGLFTPKERSEFINGFILADDYF
jgi:hypothetical protein